MRGGARIGRTVVLGAIAAALGIWWLAQAYGVDGSRLFGYLLGSVAFVAAAIALGLIGAGLTLLLRRWRTRGAARRSTADR